MSTDCLVLRIVEETPLTNKKDTVVFVLYDSYHSVYLIRGKRRDTKRILSRPYSFEAYTLESVLQFLRLIIPKSQTCIFELYAYGNLPTDKNDITFHTLKSSLAASNEVVAYVNVSINDKRLRSFLETITEVTNDYEPDEKDGLAQWNAECNKVDW
jgi:hypothetical protein